MPDGSYFSPIWNINFDLKQPPTAGTQLLTVDLAGAAGGSKLQVSVNGHSIGQIDCPNDSGIYRSAVRSANFRHNTIEFDSSLLKWGNNKVTFTLGAGKGNWKKGGVQSIITTDAGGIPEVPAGGVMYDCIQLEAGPVKGDGSYKLLPAVGQ
jgi:hypothetical protein